MSVSLEKSPMAKAVSVVTVGSVEPIETALSFQVAS